jgi:hypothetical protein
VHLGAARILLAGLGGMGDQSDGEMAVSLELFCQKSDEIH